MDASQTAHSLPETSPGTAGEDLLRGASLACRFFGMLFLNAPEKAVLRDLHEQDLLEDWPLPGSEPLSRKGLALLQEFLKHPEKEALELARRDFTDLFIGPEHPLRQWESVWTTRDKLLFDVPTLAVRACYARHGVAAPGPDPDDHIAMELAFLGELLERAAQAHEIGDGIEAQRLLTDAAAFYSEHPAHWAKDFLHELKSAPPRTSTAARPCSAGPPWTRWQASFPPPPAGMGDDNGPLSCRPHLRAHVAPAFFLALRPCRGQAPGPAGPTGHRARPPGNTGGVPGLWRLCQDLRQQRPAFSLRPTELPAPVSAVTLYRLRPVPEGL